jgi:hypothetical protein
MQMCVYTAHGTIGDTNRVVEIGSRPFKTVRKIVYTRENHFDERSKVSSQLVTDKVLFVGNAGPIGRFCHLKEDAIIDLIKDLEKVYSNKNAKKGQENTNKQRRRGGEAERLNGNDTVHMRSFPCHRPS